MNKSSSAPVTSADFNKAYSAPITVWGDIRIPKELKDVTETYQPKTSLELGCGLGRFSSFMAKQGIKATAVDFSKVAIDKAKMRVANDESKPTFFVGDVTNLSMITEQFDVSFDIGCFHCLDPQSQRAYVSEVFRLLKPGGIHLIWALDASPSNMPLSPEAIKKIFSPGFEMQQVQQSRRRLAPSHWYWLIRSSSLAH